MLLSSCKQHEDSDTVAATHMECVVFAVLLSTTARMAFSIARPYLYLYLSSGWMTPSLMTSPARRPPLGSNAQPQIDRYAYVNLFEAFANLKRVLKRSCLNASEDITGAPIMSLLIAILATQEPRKWSEVSLSSLQSGHNGCERSFMIVTSIARLIHAKSA